MKSSTQVLCLLLALSFVRSERVKRQGVFGSRCNVPGSYVGFCVDLPNCPELLQLYANSGGSQQAIYFLRLAQRSCGNTVIRGQPIICCSPSVTNNQPAPQPDRNPNQQFTANPSNPFLSGNGQQPTTNFQPVPTTRPTRPPTTTTTFNPPPPPRTTTPRPVQQKAGDCTGPDARAGTCKSLANCPPLLTRLQANPNDDSFAKFLRLSNQLCNANPPIICCPDTGRPVSSGPIIPTAPPTIKPVQTLDARLLTPEEGCGQSSVAHRKIVGGHPSQLGSWPWLALLGYESTDGIAFRCGGSLITKRHVVSAAHCLKNSLRIARLGEHDLDDDRETRHVDVNIIRSIPHPDYNPRNGRGDVSVLVLANDVQFSETIGPVCIPDRDKFENRDIVGYTPFVAGWGRTKEGGESANVLQEVQLPILANNECKERYRAQNRLISDNQFDGATICAGVLSGGKDTCQGDSGGPLMLPEKLSSSIFYYNLIGVVSYGIGCAREGIPGVYANVAYFSDWIKDKIAEPI